MIVASKTDNEDLHSPKNHVDPEVLCQRKLSGDNRSWDLEDEESAKLRGKLGMRRIWWNKKMIDSQVKGKSDKRIIVASDR